MSKPIDLIVANIMHDLAPALEPLTSIVEHIAPGRGDLGLKEQFARKLLCAISHEADMSKVYAALKSVGAPCSASDISEGITAVLERAT